MSIWIEIINRATVAELNGAVPAGVPALRQFYAVRPDPLALIVKAAKKAVRALGQVARRLQVARQRANLYAELSSMSDRTLADIGVRRADISAIVYASFSDRPKTAKTAAANDAAAPTVTALRTLAKRVNEWFLEPIRIASLQANLYKTLSAMSDVRLKALGLKRAEIVRHVIATYPATTAKVTVVTPVIAVPANDQAANDDVRLPAFPAQGATTAA